jgi:outer membrane receptor protein involved in Fe transport
MSVPHPSRPTLVLTSLALGVAAELAIFAQQPPAAQGADALEEITVTGSRIVRRDYSAQTPIVTVDNEAFESRMNVGLEATLNQYPQFNVAGSQSALSRAQTPFPAATEAPGAATINLRALGPNRALVLIDGKRVQPINGLLAVDVNTIPSAAIERVEVITGGAASVYGADAIAGVVNFILKKNFEGLDLNARYGMTAEGDGNETSLSGLFGANVADGRGNVMIGADWSKRDTILGKDRSWIREGWADPATNGGGLGSSNLTQYDATHYVDQNGHVFNPANPLGSGPGYGPYSGPLGGSSGFKINPGVPGPTAGGALGYNDSEHSYLQLPLERFSVFGSGSYGLSDNIEAFVDARFSKTFVTSKGFVSGVFNVWSPSVPYNSACDDPRKPTFGACASRHPVPAELAAILDARTDFFGNPTPNANWLYSGGLDYVPNFTTETTSNVYQIIGGLRGDSMLGSKSWHWEAYASHGDTNVVARQPEGFPNFQRIQNLFQADNYGKGFDITQISPVTLGVTGHCTSGLPIFTPTGAVDNTPSVSQDCADYMLLRMNDVTTLTQDVVEATASGTLAQLPAGEMLIAFGADYREENFQFNPDSGFNANQSYPNVVQNIILPVTVDGSTDVKEVYAEMAIPLIAGDGIVKLFEFDPGVRYSDYDSVGNVTTWKALFNWTVNDRLRFRGGKQVANRAPNIAELFTPKGGSQIDLNAPDPCNSLPITPNPWGNRVENPNRLNLQAACQELMVRDGAPPAFYVPGTASADGYQLNVFGATFPFPFSIALIQGNQALQSEEADTLTFGTVFSFDQWSMSVDWYDIQLTGAIVAPTFTAVYQQCLDPQFNPTIASAPGSVSGAAILAGNPQCALINREWVGSSTATGQTGGPRTFDSQFYNSGGINSTGIDVQFDYRFELERGMLNLSFNAGWLDTYERSPFKGAPFIDYTGTSFVQANEGVNFLFDYKTLTTIRYDRPMWSAGVRWQHLPSVTAQPGANTLPVESFDMFDLFSSWNISEKYRFQAGIDNLLNQDPATVGATLTNAARGSTNSNYDAFGRRVFVGLSISF